jgi:two-component system chemotaxis response regulator CheB
MSATRTRVLVCGDSALQRTLEFDQTLQVVGVRTTAASALAAITELRPDLVTLDVELPALGGIKAIEDIMSSTPVPILVFTAQVARDGALALSAGALDAFAKGDLDLRDPAGLAAEALRRRVQLLSQVRVIRHPRARLRRNGAAQRAVASRRLEAIGIVSSTGGPQALSVVLGALPADFPVPLLVVQHMTRGFTAGFVAWLDTVVPRPSGSRPTAYGSRPASGSPRRVRISSWAPTAVSPSTGGCRASTGRRATCCCAASRSGTAPRRRRSSSRAWAPTALPESRR